MHSRNRRAGILLGQGKTLDEAIKEVNMVVEGVYSAKSALMAAKKYNVEIPIIEQVNAVLFENKNALLIDPGLSGLRPKNMINMFENEKIIPKYIVNTHEHEDHVGACHQIKNAYPEIAIFASDEAKLFIERPELFSDFILGGKHNKFLTEKLFHRNTEKISVDAIICEGKLQKNGVDFEVINLKGHTSGSIGILTSDGVLFAGDLLIGEETLSKYDFLFLQDVEEYLKSLDIVKSLDFNYIVLAHGKKVLDKNDTILLIEKHKQAVHKYLCQIIENLKVPMNVDTLLKKIIKENELTYNYKEYYFFRTSLVSFISYLADLDKINYKLEDSDLLYYTKIK